MTAASKSIRIAGACGYWGEADMAVPQFLAEGGIDYIVFDYLAEITMSILARARQADPELGYATDFVDAVIRPHIKALAASGARLVSNAGGVNPEACARRIRAIAADAGVDLRVAVVLGDDLMPALDDALDPDAREMFFGALLPPRERIASANAYLGAFPVAEALASGADIVITGRCVDSAVTLGACIHAFGWRPDQLDLLAAGSLVGHLIECGPQVSGGNYTDWERVADSLHNVGYPIAEVSADGDARITKPAGTGGTVTVGTVGEQLLYEIGDPSAYLLPDVVCDFTGVELRPAGDNVVHVSGARGRGVPGTYKTSLTWADGWRAGAIAFYVGDDAARKARIYADEVIQRAERKREALGLASYDHLEVEVVGDESHYGDFRRQQMSREVAFKVACRHQDKRAVAILLKEFSGAALGAPPGYCGFAGTRPKPSPVIRLYSTLVDKHRVPVVVVTETARTAHTGAADLPAPQQPVAHAVPPAVTDEALIEVPLVALAWVRSGDKGDKANIGVMARRPEFLPWIARALTVEAVAARFAHFMTGSDIDRYYLPGLAALNFVLHTALGGGGVASLRNDPQAKSYGQILLDVRVAIPASLKGD